jgi:hypothetical protein
MKPYHKKQKKKSWWLQGPLFVRLVLSGSSLSFFKEYVFPSLVLKNIIIVLTTYYRSLK